ncbi:hypothetical protein DPMN_012059, partial [Dreissena polymorpha]
MSCYSGLDRPSEVHTTPQTPRDPNHLPLRADVDAKGLPKHTMHISPRETPKMKIFVADSKCLFLVNVRITTSQRLKCHLAVSYLVPVPNLSINLKEDGNQASFAFINDNQR